MFTTDRKGDHDNLRYGSIDKYKVPRYRAAGYGRLIGLDRRFKLSASADSDRHVQFELQDSSKGRTFLSARKEELDSMNGVNLTSTLADDNSFVDQEDFIQFTSSQAREQTNLISKRAQNELHDRYASESTSNYDDLYSDDDGLGVKEVSASIQREAFDQFRDHVDNIRHLELMQATKDSPNNGRAWQELIEHQNKYFRLTASAYGRNFTAIEKRAVTDMKLFLYEQGLRNVRDAESIDILSAGMMSEGAKIWDTDQQVKEWSHVLKQSGSLNLHMKYLNFQQRNPILFTYEKVLHTYIQIFGQGKAIAVPKTQLIYLVLRATLFMLEAGYVERAIAIWQALLEISYFSTPSTGQDDIIVKFLSFWDSEAARIGEDGSKGWNYGSMSDLQPQVHALPPALSNDRIFDVWAKSEGDFDTTYVLPARTLDENADNDPFRVVLSTDITDFIFQAGPHEERGSLLLAFLRFCNLPPPSIASPAALTFWKDPLASLPERLIPEIPTGDLRTRLPNYLRADSHTLVAAKNSDFASFTTTSLSDAGIVVFAVKVLTQLVESRPSDDSLAEYLIGLKHHIDPQSARKFAKSLLKKRSDRPRLYNVFAVLEASSGRMDSAYNVWSTALSMASSLNAYDEIENKYVVMLLWHDWTWAMLDQGHFDRAMSLLMSEHQRAAGFSEAAELGGGNPDITEEGVLQARHRLSGHITTSLKAGDHQSTIYFTNLLAILNYTVHGYKLNEAFRVYDSTLLCLTRDHDFDNMERLHQWRARLLDIHVRHSSTGFRPIQITMAIKTSLDLFPENSIFHNLYEKYSRRSGLIDRLHLTRVNLQELPVAQQQSSHANQAHEGKSLRKGHEGSLVQEIEISSIAASILKISTEFSRPLYAGSTHHSTRTAFRNAVTRPDADGSLSTTSTSASALDQHSTQEYYSSPLIWQTWLDWELSLLPHFEETDHHEGRQHTKIATATTTKTTPSPLSPLPPPVLAKTQVALLKEIYYSSIAAHPGCKTLYMRAFTSPILRYVIGREGLTRIYRTMTERGLRIRIDIDDFLDDDNYDGGGGGVGGDKIEGENNGGT